MNGMDTVLFLIKREVYFDKLRMNLKYEWVDDKYTAKVLKVNPSEIINVTIEPAVGKGDNYGSTLLRVACKIKCEITNNINDKKSQARQFLIKSLPEGIMGNLLQDAGLWDKEIYMYKNVLSLIEKYVDYQIGPKCLNRSSDEFKFYDSVDNKEIVLEDLSLRGYKMANRIEQLDYDHCVVVMKTLAKFHAGSAAVSRYHKKEIDYVGEEVCFRETRRESNEKYLIRPFQLLAGVLKSDAKLKRYSSVLEKFAEKFWELALTATRPKKFNVLNHGDLWTNNILFLYDETTGRVKDARLIDFQCCRYTTPAFDLQHFFMSSVKEEIRETKLQELVDVYVNYLNKELTSLGENPMSKQQLDNDLLTMDCYGLYTAISVLPVSIRDSESISDFEDVSDRDSKSNPFLKCITNKKFRKILPKILKYFDKKGLFEDEYDISDKFDVEEENIKPTLI